MKHLLDKPIGQIVTEDFRTAQVFKQHNIDFCCKGHHSLSEVASRKALDTDQILSELERVVAGQAEGIPDFKSWSLDVLADHIEKKHHRYVEEKIPVLKAFLEKLCNVHGQRHPELFEITGAFNASAGELTMHMKKEELLLFPIIRKMVKASKEGTPPPAAPFGTVGNPIRVMMEEHETEGTRFEEIRALSNGYTPPEDGCTTYRVTFSMLAEFEGDLHQHIHLENNILFPGAVELEETLS
ncbi:iron-sulfur cluster repair di-iron protein [Robiginitalea marina]|uniref:Iron-sulfur cluster repair di-iron protein n=1 Tax=Robiginitalea marina TaxID=2954105 RepID=A0ABT1AYN4_9FLAO|nr:iron-sulfur cluster repair di-iron protein [Robiginitalea marina]MCO5725034.1 iron-sulfur cluster repair di-iron protein [Robiginitalea marina]